VNPRTAVASAALLSVLALSGCAASGGSSDVEETTTAPGGGTSPSPGVSVSATQTTPSASPTAEPVAAGGGCSLIDQALATQVLGSAPGPGKSSGGLGESDGITKVDGCTYVAGGSHLGYDVLIIKGMPPTALLARAKSKLKEEGASGGAKEFSTGLDDSAGYTFKVGSGVDSQIAVIVGDHWVTVAVSRKDGDAAKTKTEVIAAAQALVSAL
jgi:hypothetical protein